ncbi:OmpA family protein [Mucilaginibacter sp. ZT4R22]|uniref:OmpA family protein n=1 Tax=Mucilaginibacter pankratovii TaxID=2772110 RepID=A0ABR7WQH3_9SPHI|nr:OmpA family protein [Mucilaginibacter pankratovii]MBD1364574.1 OmpA family protein [Mucilaginibacter pankratovii]
MKKHFYLLGALLLTATITTQKSIAQEQPFKAYNNYDFVPGPTIIFEDDFRTDQDGEFPAHWNLEGGQGVVNKMGEDEVFAITKYYSVYTPNIKKAIYLPVQYTIEFDTWLDAAYDSNEGAYLEFRKGKERIGTLYTNHSAYRMDFGDNRLNGDLPAAIGGDGYHNKWHHVAIAVNGNQMKVYCDQYRVLVVPNNGFKATSIALGGNASEGTAMLIKNFRIAEGGGMNMLGKKFTDTKIITHGINFDYNKATIKPEGMGTLNMIARLMKENPELKFEVGGHTDSDGDNAYNLNLSQQRAEAVRTQLIQLGIAAARLSAKGYGETKPIGDNLSLAGRANNRRVEFVKI